MKESEWTRGKGMKFVLKISFSNFTCLIDDHYNRRVDSQSNYDCSLKNSYVMHLRTVVLANVFHFDVFGFPFFGLSPFVSSHKMRPTETYIRMVSSSNIEYILLRWLHFNHFTHTHTCVTLPYNIISSLF